MSYMQHIMSPPRPPVAAGAKAPAGDDEGGPKGSGTLLGNVLQKSKENGGGNEASSGEGSPGIPETNKRSVYSTNGTPIGLGESFRSSPGHGGVPSPGIFGSDSMQSFPAISRLSANDYAETSGRDPSSSPPESSMDSMSSAYSRARAARPLFGDGSSLMETDLEAASALNILSNSPALKKKAVVKKQGNPSSKRSLFDTVMGVNTKKKRK